MRNLVFLLLTACADKDDPNVTTEDLYVDACLYGFRADVRGGPDAGTALTGTLLAADDDGDAEAALVATGSERAFEVPTAVFSGVMVLPDPDLYGAGTGYIAADDGSALAAVASADGAGGYTLRLNDDSLEPFEVSVDLAGAFADCSAAFAAEGDVLSAPAFAVDLAGEDTARMSIGSLNGVGRTGVMTSAQAASRAGSAGAPKASFASKLGSSR